RCARPPLSRRLAMRRILFLSVLVLAFGASAAAAQDEPVAFDASHAKVFHAPPGRALTGPSLAPGASAVAQFLRTHGVDAATAQSMKTVSQERAAKTGITHVRLEQEVAGLRVPHAYVKASFDSRGQLIHAIHNLAKVPGSGVLPARVDERAALRAAL